MSRIGIIRDALHRHADLMHGMVYIYGNELHIVHAKADPISQLLHAICSTALKKEYLLYLSSIGPSGDFVEDTCPLGLRFLYVSMNEYYGGNTGIIFYHSITEGSKAAIMKMLKEYPLGRHEKKRITKIVEKMTAWTSPHRDSVLDIAYRIKETVTADLQVYSEQAFNTNLSTYKDFVSSFSHEALSPMQEIRGTLEITLSDNNLNYITRDRLNTCLNSLDTLRVSLEGMRLLFKEDDKPLANQFRTVDIKDVAQRWVSIYHRQFEEKNIEVYYDPTDQPWNLKVVPEYFEVLIRNLISNAAKYSFDATGRDLPGKCIIKFDGTNCILSVISFGVPIPKQSLTTIFELNTRAPTASDRGRVGKGVGLYLVAIIAKHHNATVEAKSIIMNPGNFNEYARNEFIVKFPVLPDPKFMTRKLWRSSRSGY